MTYTRREFIQRAGIAIAALVTTRCAPSASKSDTPHDRLRDCWLRLDGLARETRENWDSSEQGEQNRQQLIAEHQAALDELVAAGDLDAPVAEQVQGAFVAAAYHVWRSNAPITCYESMMVDYVPISASQLVRQADVLASIAEGGDLDPNTVAQAQAVIERDMAFLSLSQAETQALYDALTQAAGDSYNFPDFRDLDLDISPEAAEAACFLTELLLDE